MKQIVDALRNDFRFALRVLRRSPWGTVSVVSVLALALGAAITILGAVRGVLLRPLPFENPSALVSVGLRDGTGGAHSGISVSEFVEWRAAARSFTDLACFRIWGFELEGSAEPERVAGARVTPNLFAVLGARS